MQHAEPSGSNKNDLNEVSNKTSTLKFERNKI